MDQADNSQAEAAREAGIAALKKEWGEAYDGNKALAERAIKTLASDAVFDKLANSGVGADPEVVSLFYKVGERLVSEGTIEHSGRTESLTPGELKEQISVEMSDPAYTDARSPAHKAQVAKVKRLYDRLYGDN